MPIKAAAHDPVCAIAATAWMTQVDEAIITTDDVPPLATPEFS